MDRSGTETLFAYPTPPLEMPCIVCIIKTIRKIKRKCGCMSKEQQEKYDERQAKKKARRQEICFCCDCSDDPEDHEGNGQPGQPAAHAAAPAAHSETASGGRHHERKGISQRLADRNPAQWEIFQKKEGEAPPAKA